MRNGAFVQPLHVSLRPPTSNFLTPFPSRNRNCGTTLLRRRRAHAIRPIVAKVKGPTDVEDALLESINTLCKAQNTDEPLLHLFRKKSPADYEKAVLQVSELEKSVGGFSGIAGGKLKRFLPGNWELVLTNSQAVEKNAGSITGLGSLPGAKCLQVRVILQKDGKAKTVEKIKVFGGLMQGENSLEGKWRLSGKGDVLEVTYAQAVLMGKNKIRADSKAVLTTTYCSQRMRVGRSSSGEFYLFVRE